MVSHSFISFKLVPSTMDFFLQPINMNNINRNKIPFEIELSKIGYNVNEYFTQ